MSITSAGMGPRALISRFFQTLDSSNEPDEYVVDYLHSLITDVEEVEFPSLEELLSSTSPAFSELELGKQAELLTELVTEVLQAHGNDSRSSGALNAGSGGVPRDGPETASGSRQSAIRQLTTSSASDDQSQSDQVDESQLAQLLDVCPCEISRLYLAHLLTCEVSLEVSPSPHVPCVVVHVPYNCRI